MRTKHAFIRLFGFQDIRKPINLALIATLLNIFSNGPALAQEIKPMIRIARIVVDSAQLENYRSALKEGMETAVRLEPGVLRMYAVYEKDHPTHVTVLEMYASEEAYRSHRETDHFKKYKDTTKNMVRSLELIDAMPIAFESKQNQ